MQEGLRRELRRRIIAGELTGTELARKTGFTQAHISNFINRKRGLKLGALDRMTKAIGLTIYDLLDPRELSRHVAVSEVSEGEFVDVPVVAPSAAMNPIITQERVQEVLRFRRAFLNRLRASKSAARKDWTRFVALQLDTSESGSMWPGASGRTTVLVDRHYESLEPYRSGKRNIYAISSKSGILARYAERTQSEIILQPREPTLPAILLDADETGIVGRIAQASLKA